MPEFFLDAGVKQAGQTDLASRPQRPSLGDMTPESREVLDFFEESAQIIQSDPTFASPDQRWDTDFLRDVIVTRAMEARTPSAKFLLRR